METDCLTLGGGFEGADLDALEAECRASGDTACSSEAWIQADAARCAAWMGSWSVELRTIAWAQLAVNLYEPHTQWGVGRYDDPDQCGSYIAAASGEWINSFCPD